MSGAQPVDAWSAGEAYEGFMGRWSGRMAARFLLWLSPPQGADWIEVGCGTGALARSIAAGWEPRAVLGLDRSLPFVRQAHGTAAGPVRFAVADAMGLPAGPRRADVVVSGLTLNFVTDPAAAVAEMARVTRAGGTVGAFVWDYAGEMQMLRHFWDGATDVDAGAAELDEGRRFPICRPEPLARLWEAAGLSEVTVAPLEIAMEFRDFDDYWLPFLAGQGPAGTYAASLSEPARRDLARAVRGRLPERPDGSIPLRARAWAVRGRR